MSTNHHFDRKIGTSGVRIGNPVSTGLKETKDHGNHNVIKKKCNGVSVLYKLKVNNSSIQFC